MQKKLKVPETTKEQQEILDKKHGEKGFLTLQEQRPHVKAIRDSIRNEERRLRKKHSWLQYQDMIGLGFFLSSIFGAVVTAHLYIQGSLHWSLTMVSMMFFGSIMHELEHDIIHNLYFSKYPFIQDIMFAVIMLQKFHISPWYRKKLHLRHHIVSGQKEDIEERLIGLGRKLDFKRLVTATNHAGVVLFTDEDSLNQIADDNTKDYDDHKFSKWYFVWQSWATLGNMTVLFHAWLGYQRAINGWTLGTYDPVNYLPMGLFPYVHAFNILVAVPNMLRHVCLNMCATYCHYYADIPENSPLYQNQILDHWALIPLQLFCFNFGQTHILHHFVPAQPFYLRQMCVGKVLKVLENHGTRRNDMDIIRRRNRYYEYKNEHEMAKAQKA